MGLSQMNNFGKSKTEGERNSIAKRGQIVGLWKSGKSINEICAEQAVKGKPHGSGLKGLFVTCLVLMIFTTFAIKKADNKNRIYNNMYN